MGTDPFTATLFSDHPILTTLLCTVKGTCAGLFAGLLYNALKKINTFVAVIAASAIAPITNTGIFIAGAYTMMDTFQSNFLSEGTSMFYFLVIGCAGFNFIFEFLFNIVFSPAIYRIINAVSSKLNPKS